MAAGYHIERHAPQGPRTTWDVLVTEDQPNNQRAVLVRIPCPSDVESQRVADEMLTLLSRFP